MAHKININNGKASFMSVRERAWHGLGQILDKPATSEEAIIEAGLDYNVVKQPLFLDVENQLLDENGDRINSRMYPIDTTQFETVSNGFATLRDDTKQVFGVVGNRYNIIQNRDAFGFFDAIVGEGEAIYETAGALGNGETIFITAKLPDYIRVGNNDDIEKYLLLTMSHDGSSSIQAMFTPIRVVCNNTLSAALSESTHKVKIRHTKSAQENLEKAHKVLGISNRLSDELSEIFNNMTNVRVSDEEAKAYFEKSLEMTRDEEGELSTKSKNILNNVIEYAEVNPTQTLPHCRGTLYGAYNAVTGYLNNVRDYKGNSNKKMKGMFFGTEEKINSNALNYGVDMLKGKSIYNLN